MQGLQYNNDNNNNNDWSGIQGLVSAYSLLLKPFTLISKIKQFKFYISTIQPYLYKKVTYSDTARLHDSSDPKQNFSSDLQ